MPNTIQTADNTLSIKLLFSILLITLIVFSPVLSAKFVNWDDDIYFKANYSLRSLNAENFKTMFTKSVVTTYVPLTLITYALEYKFFKYDPFFYHLDNLLLHMFVVVFVYFFCLHCGLSPVAGAIASLLFAIHPTRVESVAWVTERKDVLYAFFYMAAVNMYCGYIKKGKKRYYAAALVLGLFSVLSKPMALSLPLILLLLDWFLKRRIRFKDFVGKIPFGIVIAPVIWMTYVNYVGIPSISLDNSFLVWIWCAVFYVNKFIVPGVSTLYYWAPRPVEIVNAPYLIVIAIALSIVAAMYFFRRNRLFIFSILFYFFSMFFLFRFNLNEDGNVVADRFMYLAIVGFCMLVGVAIERIWQRAAGKHKKYMIATICSVVFVVLGNMAFRQCQVWQNSAALWGHQMRYEPRSMKFLVYNKLASGLRELPKYKKALEYVISDERKGRFVLDGRYKDMTRRPEERLIQFIYRLYLQALVEKPDFPNAYFNLGNFYVELGAEQGAMGFYEKAFYFGEDHFPAMLHLARLYIKYDRPDEAIALFNRAIDTDPNKLHAPVFAFSEYNKAVSEGKVYPGYVSELKRIREQYLTEFLGE